MNNTTAPKQTESIEVDLKSLWKELKASKASVCLITIFSVSLALLIFAFSDDLYEVETSFLIVNDSSTSNLSNLDTGFSGIASLAGVNLKKSEQATAALAQMKSKKFISNFVSKHDLAKFLVAGKWNSKTEKVEIDPDIFDEKNQTWVRSNHPGPTAEPTEWELYEAFSSIIKIDEDKSTGLFKLTLRWISSDQALSWANLFMMEADTQAKNNALTQARKTIDYLKEKADRTPQLSHRNVFYKLIEEQQKIVMLADTRDYFIFNVVDPAMKPIKPVSPNIKRLLSASILFGILMSSGYIFFNTWRKHEDTL
ncbi:hypothetical protein [Ketobacter sp.]|uniref:hypothetical protein n=1 Tax=Ketobacter sp. TaxID=2083498 RepID=UPI0025C73326|nr:hypothetical protein [Ketobacter sp.]